ncbi:MAG: HAD hydrolase-like protein [Microscillaceae bacterium]|nr:HAD hydrolase-like protein [Microscillaceae bacterium]
MKKIQLIVFDLSGTTVEDDNAVAKSLHQAAVEYGLNIPLEDFQKTIGTNKIHLYQFMIARSRGQELSFENLEKYNFPELYEEARDLFDRYAVIMLEYYQKNVRAMPQAEETFRWCKAQGIKVATDTGFHREVSQAIIQGLNWLDSGLIDLSVDVDCTEGIGRPAPYMIFYAMQKLGIQSVHEVIKIGDTPADLISGYNAGCIANIGVKSGANTLETLLEYPHTHILEHVGQLPELIKTTFG